MATSALRRPSVFRYALPLLVLALVVLALFVAPAVALKAWLAAAVMWSSVPLGALVLVMMIRLIPGIWSRELEPQAEAATALLPLGALAFVPVLLAMPLIYPWVAHAGGGEFRAAYLAPWFMAARTVMFFAGSGALVVLLRRRAWSTAVSCAGLVGFAVFENLIAVDWLLSLDQDFHSSGFGLYVMAIQVIVALCAATGAALLSEAPVERPEVLGSLLLCALLLWAYFAFMQYFITWSGDLPAGARWYGMRGAGVWSWIEIAIGALHLVPTALLLFAPIRGSGRWLVGLCGAVLAGKALEVVWLVLPAGEGAGPLGGVLAVLMIGGLGWLTLDLYQTSLRRRGVPA